MADEKLAPGGSEIAQVFRDIKHLAEKVEKLQDSRKINLKDSFSDRPTISYPISKKAVLSGHFGKIYAMQWASHNSESIVTAAQDGKLMVWDAMAGFKTNVMNLRSSWVMTCAWAPDGTFIAAGGLDNTCTLYRVVDPRPTDEKQERKSAVLGHMPPHQGYLSCCRFVDQDNLLTASGDASCTLWDVSKKTCKQQFLGHMEDVMCLAVLDSNTFVSGSVDRTSKLWDQRVQDPNVMTFYSHESDVNAVDVLPSKQGFVSGAEEGRIALYDLRSYAQVNEYHNPKIISEATSVAVSKSGAAIIAGYDSSDALVWDTLKATVANELGSPNSGHVQRISAVGINRDGHAIATASWDTQLHIHC